MGSASTAGAGADGVAASRAGRPEVPEAHACIAAGGQQCRAATKRKHAARTKRPRGWRAELIHAQAARQSRTPAGRAAVRSEALQRCGGRARRCGVGGGGI